MFSLSLLAHYTLLLADDERFLILAKSYQIFKSLKLLAILWNILFTTRRQIQISLKKFASQLFLILAKSYQVFKSLKLLAVLWNILFTTRRQIQIFEIICRNFGSKFSPHHHSPIMHFHSLARKDYSSFSPNIVKFSKLLNYSPFHEIYFSPLATIIRFFLNNSPQLFIILTK